MSRSLHYRALHSFPTRRSSDLHARQGSTRAPQFRHGGVVWGPRPRQYHHDVPKKMRRLAIRSALSDKVATNSRSEEHTSELQSRFDLVCRLLLEKKNYIIISHY